MKFTEDLQKFLPFGYVYLVLLGIIKESVLYYQIGINILKYSNIMDVLLSPISDLTSHPIVLIPFVIYVLLIYFGLNYLSKNYKKDWVRKFFGTKQELSKLSVEESKEFFGNKFVSILAVSLLSFFLGIGIGNGKIISEKIANNNLKYQNKLTFNTNEIKEVYLIGSNSSNYFYVEKGNKNVQISPIGAIKSLEIINKNDLK